MNPPFDQDPLQELAQALREVTSSLDERLLASEEVSVRAEQIAKELEENLEQPTVIEDEEISQILHDLTKTSEKRIEDGKKELLNLKQSTQSYVTREEQIANEIQQMTKTLVNTLQNFSQALNAFGQTQATRLAEENRKSQIVEEVIDGLQVQFDSYGVAFSEVAKRRPQRPSPKRPTKADIAREAQFLAEVQLRRDLLNQQRQRQLAQGRIVFFTALALLSFGVLLALAGILGIYFFNLAAGTITVASGTIIDLISAVVLRFNKQENERLDALTKELSILDRTTMAMQYIHQISDAEKKDQAILDLAKQLYTPLAESKR